MRPTCPAGTATACRSRCRSRRSTARTCRRRRPSGYAAHSPPSGKISAVIWTTTPWTLPGNQALNVHPDLVYNLVETDRGLLILAAELQEACLARYKLSGTTLASCNGSALENNCFRHPFYDRL